MIIQETRNGSSLTVALEGRLDNLSSPELEEFLNKNYPAITELIFEFEKVEYLSSAGLRVLLGAEKKMKDHGGILIRHPSRLVKEVFQVTGFGQILRFE